MPKHQSVTKKPPLHPTVQTWRPKSQLRRLIEKYGLKCYWCGRTCDPDLSPNADSFPTREHLIRRADGGPSKMFNLAVACRKCNNSRHRPNWKPETQKTP